MDDTIDFEETNEISPLEPNPKRANIDNNAHNNEERQTKEDIIETHDENIGRIFEGEQKDDKMDVNEVGTKYYPQYQ